MIALIRKELRENIRWAILALILLASALYYGLVQTPYGYPDYYGNSGFTICKKAFLMATSFGFPAAGFILGLIQILPELKRDRWAALLHHPLPHGAILAAKAIAGTLLYLVAAGGAFLGLVWYVATPGHLPVPFLPKMMLPGLADLITGLVYYYAALMIGLQRGGSIALRVLPFFAALHVSSFVLSNLLFRVAVEAAFLMIVTMIVATWGIMRQQDTLTGRPWIARAAFLAVSLYGVFAIGSLILPLLNSFGKPPKIRQTYTQIADTGVPVRVTTEGNIPIAVAYLDGTKPTDPHLQPDQIFRHTLYLNQCAWYIGDSRGWRYRNRFASYRESSSYLWTEGPYQYPRAEIWYNLVDQRIFAGFALASCASLGYLGQNGFVSSPSLAQPFAKDGASASLKEGDRFISGRDKLFLIHFPKREIGTVTLPVPPPLYGSAAAWSYNSSNRNPTLGVALNAGIAVLNPQGAVAALLPYRENLEKRSRISFGVSQEKDRYYVRYDPSVWLGDKERRAMTSIFTEVDAQGNVLKSYEIPPFDRSPSPPSWTALAKRRLIGPAYFFGGLAYLKIGALLGSERLRAQLADEFQDHLPILREQAIWAPLLSLIFVGCALGLARRRNYSWLRTAAWMIFVFAFNLAGLVTFWLAADRTASLPCPSCHRRRPVDRDTCPHCRAGWPALPAKSTEIFETNSPTP